MKVSPFFYITTQGCLLELEAKGFYLCLSAKRAIFAEFVAGCISILPATQAILKRLRPVKPLASTKCAPLPILVDRKMRLDATPGITGRFDFDLSLDGRIYDFVRLHVASRQFCDQTTKAAQLLAEYPVIRRAVHKHHATLQVST